MVPMEESPPNVLSTTHNPLSAGGLPAAIIHRTHPQPASVPIRVGNRQATANGPGMLINKEASGCAETLWGLMRDSEYQEQQAAKETVAGYVPFFS